MKKLFYNITGRFLAFILLAWVTASAAIVPPTSVPQLKLSWDYPAESMNTNLLFKIYHTTDMSVPVNQWTVLTNVVGTNLSVSVVKKSGSHFFAITASNAAGESGFATVTP